MMMAVCVFLWSVIAYWAFTAMRQAQGGEADWIDVVIAAFSPLLAVFYGAMKVSDFIRKRRPS